MNLDRTMPSNIPPGSTSYERAPNNCFISFAQLTARRPTISAQHTGRVMSPVSAHACTPPFPDMIAIIDTTLAGATVQTWIPTWQVKVFSNLKPLLCCNQLPTPPTTTTGRVLVSSLCSLVQHTIPAFRELRGVLSPLSNRDTTLRSDAAGRRNWDKYWSAAEVSLAEQGNICL